MKLTVDIAADGDGGVDGNNIAFLDEQFSRLVAELSDLGFGDWSAGAELCNGSGPGQQVLYCSNWGMSFEPYLSRSLMMGEEEFAVGQGQGSRRQTEREGRGVTRSALSRLSERSQSDVGKQHIGESTFPQPAIFTRHAEW